MKAFACAPLCLVFALSTFCTADAQQREIRVNDRTELAAALAKAEPGDTILLAPGKYAGGLSRNRLQGTAEKPIVVAAADAARPPVIEGGSAGLHLSNPAFVELRGLVIEGARGNGLNIDDGGSADTPAHHVTLRNLVIRDVGPDGNRDGAKLSGVDDFRVENCTFERWGSGGSAIDMVGCHDGLIAGCTFKDARSEQANGVQTKGGSRGVTVSRCRFENAGGRAVNLGGSTGLQFFRPKIEGYEAQDITVEDCTFLGSSAPVAYVGVDGAVVRHCTIYRPTRWVARILQENTDARFVPSRRGEFANNLIVFRSDELRATVNVGGNTSPETFTFSGNAWHCLDRPANTRRFVQLPVAETGGKYNLAPRFQDPAAGDLRQTDDSPLREFGVRPEK
jgi:hypothetical protein